jgi:hypothetical protein
MEGISPFAASALPQERTSGRSVLSDERRLIDHLVGVVSRMPPFPIGHCANKRSNRELFPIEVENFSRSLEARYGVALIERDVRFCAS